MSSSIPSALNPLASRREIKAISSAASSAADDPLRQEIAALKQRTAALQELKEKATGHDRHGVSSRRSATNYAVCSRR